MKINCIQFENLLSFYLNNDLSESLKKKVEEHLRECPHCNMKVKIINSIIDDIKGAYDEIINKKTSNTKEMDIDNDSSIAEISAYIDNELEYENNVKMRKNIITKPKLRAKVDKLYKLRRLMSDSFSEHKNKLKTDFSKDVLKDFNSVQNRKSVYCHCIVFLMVVAFAICFSAWVIFKII